MHLEPVGLKIASSTLLHGSLDHLIGNAIALYILGMICEHAFGRRQFVILYVPSGLAGSLLRPSARDPRWAPLARSSGWRARRSCSSTATGRSCSSETSASGWCCSLGRSVPSRAARSPPFVENGAHLGGAVSGALVTAALHPVVFRRPAPAGQNAAVLGLLGLVGLLLAYTVVGWLVL